MTELPTTFGKYFLTEKLATGGMAEIYLAKIVGPGGFEKQLVIKQIHPRLTGQRHFVDLFVAEAKTLVTLAHGNIVPVYELGVIDDTYFIAMEYIDGPTLYRLTEALSRRGVQMEPPLAAWIAAKILEGLDYAHRKGEGVIHRDLSPRNVMLSRDGEVKLVDFGIAVTLGDAESPDHQSAPTGSFPYMSPEQVRREPLTGQTDLFSLGVLLWEMLVGKRLFARPDPDATLAAVTDGAIPRPSEARPGIPAKLDDVVMRALEREPGTRWAAADEMLAALQRYLYSLEDTPGPREVAALVAKYCPPETRRLPTHVESPPADPAAPVPAGPRTAVIEQPRGKRRARTETFATHVELEHMIAAATPLSGVDKLPPAAPTTAVAPRRDSKPAESRDFADDPERDPTPVPPPEPLGGDDETSGAFAVAESTPVPLRPATSGRMRSIRPDSEPLDDDEVEQPRHPPVNIPGRTAPARRSLVLAAIGSLVLGGLALYVFLHGRGAVLRPDAGPYYDAPYYAFEPDARGGPPADASPAGAIDAATADAVAAPSDAAAAPIDTVVATPPDAAVAIVRDAATRPHPRDARIVRPHDGGGVSATRDAAATGRGMLRIGAKPWAKIVLDGVATGKTAPTLLSVTAGKHVVKLIFSGEDPPLERTFTVTVKPGETVPIQADFTN